MYAEDCGFAAFCDSEAANEEFESKTDAALFNAWTATGCGDTIGFRWRLQNFDWPDCPTLVQRRRSETANKPPEPVQNDPEPGRVRFVAIPNETQDIYTTSELEARFDVLRQNFISVREHLSKRQRTRADTQTDGGALRDGILRKFFSGHRTTTRLYTGFDCGYVYSQEDLTWAVDQKKNTTATSSSLGSLGRTKPVVKIHAVPASQLIRSADMLCENRKVHMILDALDIPLEFNETKEPQYLELNPNSRLPAIEDPNTNITVWESGAIILYLIEQYDKQEKLSYSRTPEQYALIKWLTVQVSGQGPYFGQATWFTRFHPEKLLSAIDRYVIEIFLKGVGLVEKYLHYTAWLEALKVRPKIKAALDKIVAQRKAHGLP
ncbi:hypothetical protein KCU65_g10053, partial [Aureobasidium melanogenum]